MKKRDDFASMLDDLSRDIDETVEDVVEESSVEDFIEEVEIPHPVKPILEEKVEEKIKEEKIMENKLTALQAVLNSQAFRKAEFEIESQMVLNNVANKLGVPVLLLPTPFNVFFDTYLGASKLTPAEKVELAKQYYPSAVVYGNGDGVKNLLVAKIPVSMLERKEETVPMNWTSSSTKLDEFTKAHSEFFGSKSFIPAFKKIENGVEHYYVFITTTSAVLNTLGVDLDLLRDRKLLTSITDIVLPSQFGNTEIKYVIDLHLEALEK